ncbi:MAG: peptidoglycan DD-metalloendopeptidase family protein [Peptococcaceae bacterium]|nr:peptidoglycan DD-metalloendopeptidase family protein [Peptococcaceae bacterium]MBQ2994121.1 peptidoglycan DD-metalloendopeptidase family protein [Peptococcaceae bacterium]
MNNLTAKFKELKSFIEEKGNKKYMIGAVAATAVVAALSVFSLSTSYTLEIDGTAVGQVASKAVVTQALNEAQEAAETASGLDVVAAYNKVEVKAVHSFEKDVMTDAEVAAVVNEKVDWLVKGATVNVNNGEYQFTVATAEEGQQVLDKLKADALANQGDATIKSVEFLEAVTLEEGNVKVDAIKTPAEVLAEVQAGKEAVKTHTVQKGESFWTIARNYDVTVSELQQLNPEVNPNRLKIGQVLNLNCLEPLINVVVVKEITVEESIAYATEYKETANLYRGETQVVKRGTNGKKMVTYEVKETNGATLEKTTLNEVVISEPVSAVVNKGTKAVALSSRSGDGILNWPMSGKITSPYGTRSSGFHSGIDIGGKIGRGVYSAAGGKVVLASWYYAYGNCIVVDHGNGMKTRYAHLSAYKVKVGDTVERGQLIGLCGNTGRSTGPHLHFEVIVNGSTKNPINYLK